MIVGIFIFLFTDFNIEERKKVAFTHIYFFPKKGKNITQILKQCCNGDGIIENGYRY